VLRGLDSVIRNVDPNRASTPPKENAGTRLEMPKSNSWTRLKVGMSETEVTNILGVPDRIEAQQETFRWYWEKGTAKGWVGFDGATRKMIEWRNL
jgi:outer membrane protein assembly factor BamE (lipoprotein component of BamABCDE complex)